MQKQQINSKYLSFKHPIYLGCTLEETVLVSGGCFAAGLLFSALLWLMFGYFYLWMLLFFFVALFSARGLLRKIGHINLTKQRGFLKMRVILWLHRHVGIKCPYLIRKGKWSTRRL